MKPKQMLKATIQAIKETKQDLRKAISKNDIEMIELSSSMLVGLLNDKKKFEEKTEYIKHLQKKIKHLESNGDPLDVIPSLEREINL